MGGLSVSDVLEGLNAAQREAVTATEGFVRVIAGAGSGKTRALSSRFAFLVNELGILPGNILCVTFTNKSAAEMRERIRLLTDENDTGLINTFHGFCSTVLHEEIHAVGYPKSFLVLDNQDIDAMLQTIYEERGLTLRDMTFGKARDLFEIRKLFRNPDYYRDMIAMPLETLKARYDEASEIGDILFYGYLYQEKKCFGLDYNDLLKFTLHIFAEHQAIREKWQKRLEYVMIDEFQDIDAIQYELMEVLCGWHKNLFVVGDPDQTIYTWRGADTRYLLEFDRKFPGTHTILMTENYRSSPEILRAANALIAKNEHRIPKDLKAMLPSSGPVEAHLAETAALEGKWMAERMKALHEEEGVPYREMAVLYRAHFVSRNLEEALLESKIPCAILSGTPFFGRAEVKDALSWLRMAILKDDLSFQRIVNKPKRNIGKRRIAYLRECAERENLTLFEALTARLDEPLFKGTGAKAFVDLVERFSGEIGQLSMSEALSALLDASGYEAMLRTEGSQERLDNLAELKQAVYEFEATSGEEGTPEAFFAHVALMTGSDTMETDKVRLMTIHAAKGLEFPCVFLCGMNEGILPSRKIRTLAAMEEERRLAFVAVTRAQKKLFLSEAGGWNFEGEPRRPSRFLLDIGRENLQFTKDPPEELFREAAFYAERMKKRLSVPEAETAFRTGDRVRHFVFGEGVVESFDEEKSAYVIRFDGIPTPRTISARVKLERA